MQKSLFNKTLLDLTVKDGLKLYFLFNIITVSVVRLTKDYKFMYVPKNKIEYNPPKKKETD